MPELPEVEVSRLGLLPHLVGQPIRQAVFRAPKLRHELPLALAGRLAGLRIDAIVRRGKYLLFDCQSRTGGGWLILHLGMSGSLRLVAPGTPVQKHDHVDLAFTETVLRFRPDLRMEPTPEGFTLATDFTTVRLSGPGQTALGQHIATGTMTYGQIFSALIGQTDFLTLTGTLQSLFDQGLLDDRPEAILGGQA